MILEHFMHIIKLAKVSPEMIESLCITDELLHNNQARFSSTENKLYVSPATMKLLLDPETFDAALEGLAIDLEGSSEMPTA